MASCVVEQVKLIRTFAELRERAQELGPKRVGVVLAEDDVALMAASDADCLVNPTIEAANLLAKAINFLAGRAFAHVVVGAKTPILIPSRVESAEDKVNAMALGVVYAAR